MSQPTTGASADVHSRASKISRKRKEVWRWRAAVFALVASDVLTALVACGMAFMLQRLWGSGPLSEITLAGILPSLAVWLGLRALLGLYPGYGFDHPEELRRQTYAALVALAITATFAVALQVGDLVSRLVLLPGFLGLLLLVPVMRELTKWWMKRLGLWGKQVVILASGESGEDIADLLDREWTLGYIPVAVLGSELVPATNRFTASPNEESLAEAMHLAETRGIDTVIFAMPHTRREVLARLVSWASLAFRHVVIVPNLVGVTNSAVVARDFAGTFGVEIRHNLLDPSIRRVKRTLDLTATIIGGLFALPVILVLCLLVWRESGRPIFYTDQRMGREGRLFSCLKFRTMVPNAEDALRRMLEESPEAREEYAKYHKLRDDPRVTRVGRFLRKTSLDELPQLWNILRGEMSLVGPRPYLPRESGEIGVTQSEILRVHPGITGPWQVSGRSHTSFDERVSIDAYYVRNWSVWLDLVILARTVKTLIFDRSAC